MPRSGPDNKGKSSLNTLQGRDVAAVQMELDAVIPRYSGSDKRRQPRHRYAPDGSVAITIHHPGGSVARYAVAARNLSKAGIGFLHGSFIHTGTRCSVTLQTVLGQATDVVGLVKRCVYIRKNIHEIGVRFDHPINLSEFLNTNGEGGNAADVAIKLVGRVFYVESSPTDRDLMRFHLDKLDVQSVMTGDVEEALALIDSGVAFDLAAVNSSPPTGAGLALIEGLAKRGCDKPIFLVTADENQDVYDAALEKGCSGIFTKPFTREDLTDLLSPYFPLADRTPARRDDQSIVSSLWSDIAMRPLILKYLERLQEEAARLQALTAREPDPEQLRALLLQIKGSAGGFGYGQISRTAQKLLALRRGRSALRLERAHCQELIRLCSSACAWHRGSQKQDARNMAA